MKGTKNLKIRQTYFLFVSTNHYGIIQNKYNEFLNNTKINEFWGVSIIMCKWNSLPLSSLNQSKTRLYQECR